MNAHPPKPTLTPLKRFVRFMRVMTIFCVSALAAYLANDWPSPARWTMPIEYVGKDPRRQFIAANESLDELALHHIAPPTDTKAQVDTDQVLGQEIEPGAAFQQLTIYQLSTGKIKQTFRVKRLDPIAQVVLHQDRLIVCGANLGWFLAFARSTGEVVDQEDQPQWQRIISSPTGEHIIHWGSDFAYRKVADGKANWQKIVVQESNSKPTSDPSAKATSDQSTTEPPPQLLNPRPFCWSPDGTFVLCARKGQQGNLYSLQNVRTGQHIDGPSPTLGSRHRILTRIRWFMPNELIIDGGWDPSVPSDEPANQSYSVTWADEDRLKVQVLDQADPRFTELADDQWHLFADGTVIRMNPRRVPGHWLKIIDIIRPLKLERYVGTLDETILNVNRFRPPSYAKPVTRRSFPQRWLTMLQRAHYDPVAVTRTLLVQPNYLGVIENERLQVYSLSPLMPTWLFQLIVFLSVLFTLGLLNLLWHLAIAVLTRRQRGAFHA